MMAQTANRWVAFCNFRRAHSTPKPVEKSKIPAIMKSDAVQNTSSVNCMATKGSIRIRTAEESITTSLVLLFFMALGV